MHNLLVITVGTVAAGVGQEFIKQVKKHPASELRAVVRYIDTTYLPNRYSNLHKDEWFQMSIDSRLMDAIYKNLVRDQGPKTSLYPDLFPQTKEIGSGGSRYNGAEAV